MNAAKKTAATTRKPAAKKPVARKPRAKRAPAPPMTEHIRAFASGVMGAATESALANEHLGVKRQATSEMNGNRSGMTSRITLDDGTRLMVQVSVRPAPIAGRRGRKKVAADEDTES